MGKIHRKISIVIFDTGPNSYSFRLEGDTDRIGKVPESMYTPAEKWAAGMMILMQRAVKQSGMPHTIQSRKHEVEGSIPRDKSVEFSAEVREALPHPVAGQMQRDT